MQGGSEAPPHDRGMHDPPMQTRPSPHGRPFDDCAQAIGPSTAASPLFLGPRQRTARRPPEEPPQRPPVSRAPTPCGDETSRLPPVSSDDQSLAAAAWAALAQGPFG